MKKQILFASLVGMVAGTVLISSPAYAIRILVTKGDRVQEIDTYTNSVTWEYVEPEGEALFSADRLPNKHMLITLYDKVFEVNEYGQIVWERHADPLGGTIT